MKDFLLDTDTKDLATKDGDLHVGESDTQHKELLVVTGKGSWKEFPATGVGAADYLEAEDAAGFLREVRTQYNADGMQVKEIGFDGNKLKTDASY